MNRFASRIEEFLANFDVLGPGWDEAPLKQLQRPAFFPP